MPVACERPPKHWVWDSEFHAGNEACGQLIIGLLTAIREASPGWRLLVVTADPAAPLEVPAWCRMTGNALLGEAHPFYLMQSKPAQQPTEGA